MSQKDAIAKAPERRVRRASIGRPNVLTVNGKDPDFEYRVVNDTGDRVAEFVDRDWEVVSAKSVRIGDKRVNSSAPEGTVAQANLGRGMKGYVMRIPKEFYEQDQAAKQAEVMKTEQATKQEALDGTYGKLEISRS